MMRRLRGQRGATLVEFVIVFPLAALFVLSIIQFGLIYMAKLQFNHATFMAARVGAVNNANQGKIFRQLAFQLNPFFEEGGVTNDLSRIRKATAVAVADAAIYLHVEVLNPSAATFSDFGLYDPVGKVRYIPNDNLEFRDMTPGAGSKENIRDANLLKIRAVYGYQMKVPLIAGIIRRIMCGGTTGVTAWQGDGLPEGGSDCFYYVQDRIPLESFAIVEMQSRAEQ
jgi:hypothetical protein